MLSASLRRHTFHSRFLEAAALLFIGLHYTGYILCTLRLQNALLDTKTHTHVNTSLRTYTHTQTRARTRIPTQQTQRCI